MAEPCTQGYDSDPKQGYKQLKKKYLRKRLFVFVNINDAASSVVIPRLSHNAY
jgi:hypothetical protein